MVSRILRRGAVSVALLVFAATAPLIVTVGTVGAQQPALDAARARALFHEAVAVEAAGDYATALSKFEQVATFKNTPQVRFNIAVCQEKLSRWVVALGEYRIALAEAQLDPNASLVVQESKRAIASLEPKIPSLTLNRGAGAQAAEIAVDGRAVADPQFGIALLLDVGKHVVEATAQGYQPLRKDVELTQGQRASLDIALEESVAAVASSASASASAASAPASSAPTISASSRPPSSSSKPADSTPPPPSHGAMKTFAWIALGAGVAGGITAGVFYVRRASDISDLDGQCGPDRQSCPASAQAIYDRGQRDTLVGNIGLGIGVVGVLTGVVLLASSSRDSSAPRAHQDASRAIRLAPWAQATGLGGAVAGSF
jgi:hypothetical protein